ncbi:transposable element Tcb2 transposase [Trichonephila clavipes]|nr:transposable element Tcb2 transposase [Trichonephila clavipes]
MINGHTRLHVVANGTMTGQRYIDEVLLSHVRLFRGAVGDKFVFMDDNATCHRTLAVQDCLDSEGIQSLVWPARSPDLNPIENVWDALGRQVAGRNYPPTNKNTLIRTITEEWDKLPQHLLDNVVQNLEGEKDFHDDQREEITDFVQSIPGFQECDEEGVETWMACDAEDCGFQMLNDDEIVTFVQEEYDTVDAEMDTDENNNNNNESSKGPSNADAFNPQERSRTY